MALLADAVSLFEPSPELVVHVLDAFKPKVMDVVPSRDGVDAAEAPILKSPGKNHVTVDPGATWSQLGEGHANLERDPSLLRQDPDGADPREFRDNRVEDRADIGLLAFEVVIDAMPSARMFLVAICEDTTAPGTTPKRARGLTFH